MEIISLILNVVLGGGLITILTIKPLRKKAEADAKSIVLDNEEKTLQMQVKYIVEPIKKEINGLRKEIKRLERAIDTIGDCPHADNCPVRLRLQTDTTTDEPSGSAEA